MLVTCLLQFFFFDVRALFSLVFVIYLFYYFNTMSEFAILLSILALLLTLFTVLTERKFLAYAQRRMGPTLMGRNGAFQIGLDLVKLLTKEIFLIPRPTTALAPFFLSLLFAFQLLFSQNFI